MGLQLFNSLTSRAEAFVPLTSGPVRMYSCGPTVYSQAHLGNLRAYLFSDVLRRTLQWSGYAVESVVNITDVGHTVGESDLGEDKIEAAARRELRSVRELTDHYTELFRQDLATLNVLPATHQPRASDYVPQMVEFARVLDERGYTYRLPSGLYFDTSLDPDYGLLAKAKAGLVEQRDLGEEGKRHPADFAVWRSDTPDERRVMRWDSPWGPGVPGWHLECSVMSLALLGSPFDLHTGGVDHREIHHVNEMAQSAAYLGIPAADWVRTWMHNEFLLSGGQKISKSAGRMPLLSDVAAAGLDPMAFRYLVLTAHYRRQLNFTEAGLRGAATALGRLRTRVPAGAPLVGTTFDEIAGTLSPAGREWLTRIDTALTDDLNTPRALAEVTTMLRSDLDPAEQRTVALAADTVLGLGLAGPADAVVAGDAGPTVPDGMLEQDVAAIEELVARRQEARAARDFAEADRVRDELHELGVEVTDTPDGPRWTVTGGS
ncbi:cysteine--tRNA ligase [Nakamurella flavida]|uniref:Cysteine--tRNA ligase n=1 Tax=Nakamurella flavida TaxID=363630 RepID=A0A939C685_9ACTN|nr:cysteine--tRNA ligase [Nakamurella flavida]MBM9477749.1 cysteine--tRNA ligase [Nakamurella flavida]MDP9779301.1 cysteinyl-tRNA synthetase [Nakamurella flavida]